MISHKKFNEIKDAVMKIENKDEVVNKIAEILKYDKELGSYNPNKYYKYQKEYKKKWTEDHKDEVKKQRHERYLKSKEKNECGKTT